jgi:hypothetical protein
MTLRHRTVPRSRYGNLSERPDESEAGTERKSAGGGNYPDSLAAATNDEVDATIPQDKIASHLPTRKLVSGQGM